MKAVLWRAWWHWLRWPAPLWRITRRASVTIGGQRFSFVGVHATAYLSWLQGVRLGLVEPQVTAALLRSLRHGDTFVDVGGYVGGYALLASRLVGARGTVVVFEPDPVVRGLLERNLRANAATNVTVVPGVVAGHTGRALIDARGDSTSVVVPAGDHDAVPSWTLDDYLRELGGRADVILMDIEGGEAQALTTEGAAVAVEGARAVIVEIHAFAGVDYDEIASFFAEHDMHATRLDERDPENFNVVFE